MANMLISHSFQELAQARAAGSPGKALPASSSSFLQQQAATITNLQGEKAQLRSTLSRLQGQISDLEEERAQNKVCEGVVLIPRSSHHPVFDRTLGRSGNKDSSDGIHDCVFSRCVLLLSFHFCLIPLNPSSPTVRFCKPSPISQVCSFFSLPLGATGCTSGTSPEAREKARGGGTPPTAGGPATGAASQNPRACGCCQ